MQLRRFCKVITYRQNCSSLTRAMRNTFELAGLSTDRPCEIRYLWTPTTGLSRANNHGIQLARYELLVFTHDDVLAPPSWLGAILRALVAAGPRSVVTGKVLPTAPEVDRGFVPTMIVDELAMVYEGRIGKDVLYPLNMAMHRAAVEEIGPFDERLGPGTRFHAAEDNDFGLRLLEAGFRICYAPEAAIYHRAWRNDRLRLRWRYGRGQGGFFAKHFSLDDPYIAKRMMGVVKKYGARGVRRAFREPYLALGDATFVAGVLSGALEWMLIRRLS